MWLVYPCCCWGAGGRQRVRGFATNASHLVQTVTMSVAGVSQSVAAQTVVTVVGGGGVQSWSGDHGGSSMIDGSSSVHHGIGLGGNLVGVGVRCGHRVDGLHNRSMDNRCGGVALDDRSMRDDGCRAIGGCQGGTVAHTVAVAVGRDETGVGNGAQSGQDGDLQSRREERGEFVAQVFGKFVA